jgi:hypothetical protein
MTAVDEPVDVAGLVAADGDRERYWQRVYATLRAYPGLRPDDRVSRCGRSTRACPSTASATRWCS